MNTNSKTILILWIVITLLSTPIFSQVILAPKPTKDKIERERLRNERRLTRDIPAKGWHFATSVGSIIWGSESECNCNALAADVGLHYLNASGLVLGTQLILTNTVSSTLTPTFKFGYNQINTDGSVGLFSTSLIAGRSIGNIISWNSSSSDEYSGFMYGGEIGLHPKLGRDLQLKGILAIGWLTHRENFKFDRFGVPTETKMTHSGIRIRFGIMI